MMTKSIKGFEGEPIQVSEFGEWVGKDYIDYKFEYENQNKIIEHLQKEIEKKDKIIDEMLEEYEYNERINIKNFCDDEMRKNTCIQYCKSCIKQYFEGRVKND